jgi:hypothetical protein
MTLSLITGKDEPIEIGLFRKQKNIKSSSSRPIRKRERLKQTAPRFKNRLETRFRAKRKILIQGEYDDNEPVELGLFGRKSRAERQAKRASKKAVRKEKKVARKTKRKDIKAKKKAIRKLPKAQRKQAKKALRKERGGGLLKRVAKKIAKVSLAPTRNAFLLGVKLNLLNLAVRLAQGYKKDPQKIKDFWVKKFGGNWEALKTEINRGSKKKKPELVINGGRVTGVIFNDDEDGSIIGPAAALAVAIPIITAVVPLLKSLGVKENEEEEAENEEGQEALTEKFIQDQEDAGNIEEMEVEEEEDGEEYEEDGEEYEEEEDGEASGSDLTDALESATALYKTGKKVLKKRKIKRAKKKSGTTTTTKKKKVYKKKKLKSSSAISPQAVTETETEAKPFYKNPLVWVGGGAILYMLLRKK